MLEKLPEIEKKNLGQRWEPCLGDGNFRFVGNVHVLCHNSGSTKGYVSAAICRQICILFTISLCISKHVMAHLNYGILCKRKMMGLVPLVGHCRFATLCLLGDQAMLLVYVCVSGLPQ